MSAILITGGMGFVGSHMARKLVNNGINVVLFDINTNERLIQDIKQDFMIAEIIIL